MEFFKISLVYLLAIVFLFLSTKQVYANDVYNFYFQKGEISNGASEDNSSSALAKEPASIDVSEDIVVVENVDDGQLKKKSNLVSSVANPKIEESSAKAKVEITKARNPFQLSFGIAEGVKLKQHVWNIGFGTSPEAYNYSGMSFGLRYHLSKYFSLAADLMLLSFQGDGINYYYETNIASNIADTSAGRSIQGVRIPEKISARFFSLTYTALHLIDRGGWHLWNLSAQLGVMNHNAPSLYWGEKNIPYYALVIALNFSENIGIKANARNFILSDRLKREKNYSPVDTSWHSDLSLSYRF